MKEKVLMLLACLWLGIGFSMAQAWSSSMVDRALESNQIDLIHKYTLDITTEFEEKETLVMTAVSQSDAELLARELV